MSDIETSNEQNKPMTDAFDDASMAVMEIKPEDGIATEISELSKKGYVYLKDNRTDEAIESFKQILEIEDVA